MKRAVAVGVAFAIVVACKSENDQPVKRAELKRIGPSRIQVIPGEGQLPYCLVYTFSDTRVTRQLTMNRYNESVKCEAGKPIANKTFRIPPNEGNVRVFVFFSDKVLNAGSIADQIMATGQENPKFRPMDLRLPGRVVTETLTFDPEEEAQEVVGGRINADGGIATPPTVGSLPDAGTAATTNAANATNAASAADGGTR